MGDARDDLAEVFRDVFDDEEMLIEDGMESKDVDGWDSLMHINLLVAAERKFGISFTTGEMAGLKQPGQTIGSLRALVRQKVAAQQP